LLLIEELVLVRATFLSMEAIYKREQAKLLHKYAALAEGAPSDDLQRKLDEIQTKLRILELEHVLHNDRIEYKAIEDKDGKRATELLGVIRATREDLSLLRKQLPPPLPSKSSFLSSCFHLLFILFYNQVKNQTVLPSTQVKDQAVSPSTKAKKGLN
jgi:hypothetical protein